eukprot:CAMPEP_0194357452 /NCGR_PEP_ID=MMETSP0174-20130528/4925_1 /TAXON_ID=216777 /ORGANISM="Proboscia alata, Strain PI-D3" /LENGTH=456 /DNA_ID=CAMNT_0039127475 /DNA_START=193 /DNA_END=1563 /DNA_ORIENTATION=-
MTHRNSYAQASSPYPGPEKNAVGRTTFSSSATRDTGIGLITLCFSSPYPNGETAVWASTGSYIIKATTSLNYIDKRPKNETISESEKENLLSGAYTLVDNENIFYVPELTGIRAYGDQEENVINSPIDLKRTYDIPAVHLSDAGEVLVGMTITYDGYLAFVTSRGLVGVVSRNFTDAYYYPLTGGDDEQVSNSIACDESGGIYVVSSTNMYRVQWTGSMLSTSEEAGGWIADYESQCAPDDGVSLGVGSGSTPSLMGTDIADDKFVVITDCQDVMNLVIFWRDQIPNDWERLPGIVDRRIAGQVPVTFGNPSTNFTFSEQSVLVRGYGAMVVNNELRNQGTRSPVVASGIDFIAPRGAEKFEWDPSDRSLKSSWANVEVSIPNGIPTMSQKSNLVYGVGHKRTDWSFLALDWTTGEVDFDYPFGTGPRYNSAYAGTEIGRPGQLYTGILTGMTHMS